MHLRLRIAFEWECLPAEARTPPEGTEEAEAINDCFDIYLSLASAPPASHSTYAEKLCEVENWGERKSGPGLLSKYLPPGYPLATITVSSSRQLPLRPAAASRRDNNI